MNLGKYNHLLYNGELFEYFDKFRVKDEVLIEAIEIVNGKYGFDGLVDEWYCHLFEDNGQEEFEMLVDDITDVLKDDTIFKEVLEELQVILRYMNDVTSYQLQGYIRSLRLEGKHPRNMDKIDFLEYLADRNLCYKLGIEDGDDMNYIIGYRIKNIIIEEQSKLIRELREEIGNMKHRTSLFQ